MKNQFQHMREYTSLFFIIIPSVLVLVGFFFLKTIKFEGFKEITSFFLFSSLLLLLAGFYWDKKWFSQKAKILGWMLFSFFWVTKISDFLSYHDLVNVFLCVIGIYVLFYLAYHEWLSIKIKKNVSCLNWIAGAASISGLIYFSTELTPFSDLLIRTVAFQSGMLLNIFTGNVEVLAEKIFYSGKYAVTIIFACTAIQSMVLFVGMILPLKNVGLKRKCYGLLITLPTVYVLNLLRNASIVYMISANLVTFDVAHNLIGKTGSLIALIALLVVLSKIIPEIFDEINCLLDLPKRYGPIEKIIKKHAFFKN